MNQSKLGSFYEALMNIAIGFIIALASQLVIFPTEGIDISMSANIRITLWFTLVSIIRSYVIRRWFNARLHQAATKLARETT